MLYEDVSGGKVACRFFPREALAAQMTNKLLLMQTLIKPNARNAERVWLRGEKKIGWFFTCAALLLNHSNMNHACSKCLMTVE